MFEPNFIPERINVSLLTMCTFDEYCSARTLLQKALVHCPATDKPNRLAVEVNEASVGAIIQPFSFAHIYLQIRLRQSLKRLANV